MPKNTNKTKKHFDHATDPKNEKQYTISMKFISYFSTLCQNSTQTSKLKPNQTLLDET